MAKVLVTGATGYIAGFVITKLLDLNFPVRATTTNVQISKATPSDYPLSQVKHLTSHPRAKDLLEFVYANLSDKCGFDSAISGCHYVIHLAANVNAHGAKTNNLEEEFVKPTIQGSVSILHAALRTVSVKRVIYISSMFAITTNFEEKTAFSETKWNTQAQLDSEPYAFSKTAAEKAVWEFMNSYKPDFNLVVICPTGVLGPHLSPKPTEVTDVIKNMMNGWNPLLPQVPIPIVDVRDLAESIVAGMLSPKKTSERYLCGEHCVGAYDVALLLKKSFPNAPLPVACLSTSLFKMMPNFGDEGIAYGQRNCGKIFKFDCSKIKTDLGIEFRPAEESVIDCAQTLVQLKQIYSYPVNPYIVIFVILLGCFLALISSFTQ